MLSKWCAKALFVSVSTMACFVSSAAIAGTISYSYDRLGRLSEVAYPGGAIVRFNYDANGNRTSYVVTGSSNIPPGGTTPVGQAQLAAPSTVKSTSPLPPAK